MGQPVFDRVDYASPQKCLDIPASMGTEGCIRQCASEVVSLLPHGLAEAPEAILSAIAQWIAARFKHDESYCYTWRDFDTIIASAVYGGCAAYALIFGALARAFGIPIVWVKTMDVDWIQEFVATSACNVWRGHVFLEVFLHNRWMLLDPEPTQLYADYETDMRLLPGNRYAYDKGLDPYEIILSLDFEKWKEQTTDYFLKFDLTHLQTTKRVTGSGRNLGVGDDVIYIAGNSPVYQWVTEQCSHLGWRVRYSFNTDFEAILPMARGCHLIVAAVGGEVVLPAEYHNEFLPLAKADLRQCMATMGNGTWQRILADGTRVTLIFGCDLDVIRNEIQRLQ